MDTLYTILLHSHSGLRWIVLAALVYAVLIHWLGWRRGHAYRSSDRILAISSVALIHVQLVLGIILYVLVWGSKVDFGQMANSMIRFYTVEHSLMMILAVVLITWSNAKAKRISDASRRYKLISISWLIALLIILTAIPWPFRAALGAGWF